MGDGPSLECWLHLDEHARQSLDSHCGEAVSLWKMVGHKGVLLYPLGSSDGSSGCAAVPCNGQRLCVTDGNLCGNQHARKTNS